MPTSKPTNEELAELRQSILEVQRDHLCECETCQRSSAICPGTAGTLIEELASARLTIRALSTQLAAQRERERRGMERAVEKSADTAFNEVNQWHTGSCPAPDDQSILRCECGVGNISTCARQRVIGETNRTLDAIQREMDGEG